MHVVVALKLRNEAQLDAFLAGPHAPLSSAEFVAQYAPTQAQVDSAVQFLTAGGFRNIVVAPNRLQISADAPASAVQATFATTISQVHTKDGRVTYANTDAVRIPQSMQGTIKSVIGLQDVHRAHPTLRALTGIQPKAITGHNPTQFSSIYGGSGVPTAAGVTVGIITQGSLTNVLSDLSKFTSNNGLAAVTTQTVQTGSTSTDTSGDGEWDLDSQDIVGMGGGQVGKIIFYNIPTLSNSDLTADINTVVSRNEAKIINVSLGECETSAQGDGSAAAQDTSFKQAVAQGQTFSVSTGDSGADECSNGGVVPSWPAASQYVVAVAGTQLDASTTTWNSEVVWNDIATGGGATGGSASTFEPKPSWQTLYSGSTRGVADVAFDAAPGSGATVIVDGASQQIGGTSLAAPLFSGLWARMIAAKGTSIGFAGPLIYQLPASAFHDITSGNNNGSNAGPGYDLATGRGSMIMSSVLSNLGGGGGGGGGGGTVLQNGVAVTNLTAATNAQLNYTMSVPAGATNLKFAISGGTGDADLYVKFGSAPTLSSYDCRPYITGNNESCPIATAQAGTYYVMLNAYAAFSGVQLVGSYTAPGAGGTPVANFTFTTSGLTATFTDTSTDTGGSIGGHSWTFGDGGTSTAANPSHAYASGGTYSVTETVTDSVNGKTSSKTSSVTVSGGSTPKQLVVNGGFESSVSPWSVSAGAGCPTGCSGESAHAGTGFVWMDGYGSAHTDTVSQSFTVPAGVSTGTLQFYLHIDTAETGSSAYDTMTVKLGSTTVATFSNLNAATGYQSHSYNVSVTPGQSLTLTFTGTEDSSLQTSFVLDDVTFTVQ